MNRSNEGILALDIGSGKIAGVVGAVEGNGFQILSAGANNHPGGFKNGRVVDFKQALTDLKQTIARICYFSNVSIRYLILNTSLSNVDFNFRQKGILLPENISQTMRASELLPFLDLVDRLNIELLGFIPDALAVSSVLVKAEEKARQVLLLDCGRNFVRGAYFQEGSCQQLFEVPLGGRHITNDIAYGLSLDRREAEGLKIRYSTDPDTIDMGMSVQFIAEITDARLKEIFSLVRQKANLFHPGNESLVVLTGGLSKTRGIMDVAKSLFGSHIMCRYYPVSDCEATVGSEWEIGPVGLLSLALESPEVREKLVQPVTPPHTKFPIPHSVQPVISDSPSEPFTQNDIISAVEIQAPRPGMWTEMKQVFEEIF